jgi:hypothetical protein
MRGHTLCCERRVFLKAVQFIFLISLVTGHKIDHCRWGEEAMGKIYSIKSIISAREVFLWVKDGDFAKKQHFFATQC